MWAECVCVCVCVCVCECVCVCVCVWVCVCVCVFVCVWAINPTKITDLYWNIPHRKNHPAAAQERASPQPDSRCWRIVSRRRNRTEMSGDISPHTPRSHSAVHLNLALLSSLDSHLWSFARECCQVWCLRPRAQRSVWPRRRRYIARKKVSWWVTFLQIMVDWLPARHILLETVFLVLPTGTWQ